MGPEGDVVDAILTGIPLCDFNGIRSMKLPSPDSTVPVEVGELWNYFIRNKNGTDGDIYLNWS